MLYIKIPWLLFFPSLLITVTTKTLPITPNKAISTSKVSLKISTRGICASPTRASESFAEEKFMMFRQCRVIVQLSVSNSIGISASFLEKKTLCSNSDPINSDSN